MKTSITAFRILNTALYALSILAFNPFLPFLKPNCPYTLRRGHIWTLPKATIVGIIIIVNLMIILRLLRNGNLQKPSRSWFIAAFLWSAFIVSGTISSILALVYDYGIFVHVENGDGLLYWVMIAILFLSQALIISASPNLLQHQISGLIIGGFLCSIAILPQLFNPFIDYTVTSGLFMPNGGLASGVGVAQMPIGFYSHRGHAGFVLATIALLTLIAGMRKWLPEKTTSIVSVFLCLSLFLTRTRGPIIAFFVGIIYLFYIYWKEKSARDYIIKHGLFIIVIAYSLYLAAVIYLPIKIRDLPGISVLAEGPAGAIKFTSGRVYLYKTGIKGILKKPFFGWGFNGFIPAYRDVEFKPLAEDTTGYGTLTLGRIVNLSPLIARFKDENNRIITRYGSPSKAHSFLVDMPLSTGLIGTLIYCTLFGFCFVKLRRSRFRGFEVAAIVYTVYVLLWFESAQYSHIVWWVLATGVSWSDEDCISLINDKKTL